EVVLRGLAVDPAHRWPSMDALIEALGRDPDARRRRIILAAAAATVLAGASVMMWRAQRDPADACETDGHELAGIWDKSRKDSMNAAFAKTGKPYAAHSFAAVSRNIDSYTTRWRAMRKDACLATRVRGTQSADLL